MKDYINFNAEELAQDPYFIEWVKHNNISAETFWQDWLETYPFKRNDVEIARQIILIALKLPKPEFTNSEINDLKESIFLGIDKHQIQKKKKIIKLVSYLLLVACLAAFGMFIHWNLSLKTYLNPSINDTFLSKNDIVEISNHSDKVKLVQLPDGSSALLKKGSSVSFQNPFPLKDREVFLKGEAFFEISKDSSKPFYVYTSQIVTKVLGTSFYISEKNASVKVKTGKVSVYKSNSFSKDKHFDKSDSEEMILTENQQAYISNDKISLQLKPSVETGISKTPEIENMMFEYDEITIEEIFKQIEIAYQIQIVFDKNIMGKCPITASLTGVSLNEKLTLLCKAVKADFVMTNKRVTVSGTGCN